MIPREAKRGRSFSGAGLYYLHDKDALTSERVAFTYTENLPTNDPKKALMVMTTTAADAQALKRSAGIKTSGGRSEKPVYCFSLSWHPEEQPEQEHMISAGRQALTILGLSDHETLMVAHQDEAHPHIHLIVNAVNPNDGRANSLKFSKRKLSQWAEQYEREHGKIYCQQRVENNERRRQQEYVKYKDPELDQKAVITALYNSSDNGKAFEAALAEAGYKLAQGKRLVLIDRDGKMHSLTRQIEGVQAKAIRERLSGLQLPAVDEARGQQEQRGNERDENQQKQEKPLQKTPENKQEKIEPKKQQHFPAPLSAQSINRTQDRHLAEMGSFYTESQHKRLKLTDLIEQQYGEHERQIRRDIAKLDEILKTASPGRRRWLKVSGQIPKNAEENLENMQCTLKNIEQRKNEAQQKLENEIKNREQVIKTRQEKERGIPQPNTPMRKQETEKAPSPTSDFKKAAQSAPADRGQQLDPPGPEIEQR